MHIPPFDNKNIPIVDIDNSNMQIINCDINAMHEDGIGVKVKSSTASIHKSTIFTTDESCLYVDGESKVDLTYSTLKASTSNSTGVYMVPSTAAGKPEVVSINNIINYWIRSFN